MVMTRSMKLKKETNSEDQLSSLPEALLTHILSFLSTKESVSTSVLSTRWRYLFAFVPVLDFQIPYPCPNPKEFVKFVNRVLSLHDVSCTIRKFRMEIIGGNPCNVSDVSSWITAAIRRSAQNIDIEVQQNGLTCPLPKTFFTSQVLVKLNLCGGFVFDVTGPVSLPCLKSIYMFNCKFSNGDSAKRLFSSCPVLEDLSLWWCDSCDGNAISISVLSLERLLLYDWSSGCEWELINVPQLETLDLYICNSNTTKCSSVNILKSLRKASVYVYCGEVYDMIWKVVNKFEEVQYLSLIGRWMESLARDLFSVPMLKKLTTLELVVDFSRGWKFFLILLERLPCLELLVIKGDRFSTCDEEFLEIDILLPKCIPICLSQSLKKVELLMFKEKKVEYEWLGYLLKNAEVLERLTVDVSLVDEDEEVESKEKLLALPRGSLNCQIVVRERNVC